MLKVDDIRKRGDHFASSRERLMERARLWSSAWVLGQLVGGDLSGRRTKGKNSYAKNLGADCQGGRRG